MHAATATATLSVFAAIDPPYPPPRPGEEAAPTVVEAGPLRLEIFLTRTAHLFHVVDQIAEWSPYCHGQYRGAFVQEDGEISDADRAMLEAHRSVRAERSWGAGLEAAFYTPADLETALAEGVEGGHLTEAQATIERAALQHFAGRVDRLFAQERPTLEAFRDRLVGARDDLRAFAERVSRFCHGVTLTVPAYLIANPADHDFGGGYNGERLTLEVPRACDAYPAFLHEVFHAFLHAERERLQAAVAREPTLDYVTLNEGLAYALAPGIFHPAGEQDPLAAHVAQEVAAKSSLDDPRVRVRRLGLALRPLLREALDDEMQTLATFLPRALDAWRVLWELDAALRVKSKGWFSAGPGYRKLGEIARARGQNLVWSFNHSRDHYEQILQRAAPGARLMLLFALDHRDRHAPAGYEDLLPLPWPEIEARLRRGEPVARQGRARALDVVVLAAPTVEQLERLIGETELLAG